MKKKTFETFFFSTFTNKKQYFKRKCFLYKLQVTKYMYFLIVINTFENVVKTFKVFFLNKLKMHTKLKKFLNLKLYILSNNI